MGGCFTMSWITIILFSMLVRTHTDDQTCKVIGETDFLQFSKEGDFIIGGVFAIESTRVLKDNNYKAKPYSYCNGWNDRELKFARTMMFAVDEINRDQTLLSGMTLGYRVYSSCGTENLIRAAVEAVNGKDSRACNHQTLAVIGQSESAVSQGINSILSAVSVPQLSHLSTSDHLSDKKQFPTFFRTVPSDHFQITALVQLLKHFDWRWVGIVFSAGVYSEKGTADFIKEAKKKEICVEFNLKYSKTRPEHSEVIVETLKKSSSKVVLMFMSLSYAKSFLSKIEAHDITGKQWIGTEPWITQAGLASVQRKHILHGALGFTITQAFIPGLGDFLLRLKPLDEPQSDLIKAVWGKLFDCSFSPSNSSTICTGAEDLRMVSSVYTDVTSFTAENNLYKAVYSVAYALRSLLLCRQGLNPNTGKPCVTKTEVQPQLVLEHMKHVNFTTKNGDKFFFYENGDSPAHYDIVNWQMKEDGSVEIVKIGQYVDSLPERKKIFLMKNAKVVWGGGAEEVIRSVCREPCPPGSQKAVNKFKPVCCFDCFECPEGRISNQTNSPKCLACHPEFWPNEMRNKCLPKPTEYFSYNERTGVLLTGFGIGGIFLSLLTSIIFFVHKETPIVRANNSELSFLLLFSLKLCFLCSLTFIGRPSKWSCMLRHTAFSITFVLGISCVLGKTMMVLMAFRATLPGSKVIKWFGPLQQRLSVLIFTFIQVVICTLWLTTNPPFPNMNMKYYKDRIILECALGSVIGFWAVLGYIGFLAALCFILAFLARKLPDSFNEAKLITFSMLIFCSVWIAFIPAYVSSPGKFTVAVEIFAILASSFALLICIFAPKCFIIVFMPEKNNKKHVKDKLPRSLYKIK